MHDGLSQPASDTLEVIDIVCVNAMSKRKATFYAK